MNLAGSGLTSWYSLRRKSICQAWPQGDRPQGDPRWSVPRGAALITMSTCCTPVRPLPYSVPWPTVWMRQGRWVWHGLSSSGPRRPWTRGVLPPSARDPGGLVLGLQGRRTGLSCAVGRSVSHVCTCLFSATFVRPAGAAFSAL